ncbi:GntR family transcriptional regulator [Bradyrhizobium sp. LjRoot220]|uniref:GntR family transcriptional regulator n=1 Tax=Bradyrhizobium sp. LjRoot220 TaxID=3342284 RepID=UPI003ED106B9
MKAKKLWAPAVSQRLLAYEGFREQIMSAQIRPGQFVSQRELSERLGLPLGAVREMIPRLEAARLIVTVPKRGLQVASVDLKLVRNAFQVRIMIECEAVRHFTRTAADQELDVLEDAHRDILRRAEAAHDREALDADARAVDWGMHDRMVDAMGNEILSEIYRVNSLHVRLIRIDADRVVRLRVLPAMQEHLVIIAALKKRDEAATVAAMTAHIESSKQRVLEAMLLA